MSTSFFSFFFFPVIELGLFAPCSYTLGGFFLASYDDSPAGAFDEVCVFQFLVLF